MTVINESLAYRHGVRAHFLSEPSTLNPYKGVNPELELAFQKGWKASDEDDQANVYHTPKIKEGDAVSDEPLPSGEAEGGQG